MLLPDAVPELDDGALLDAYAYPGRTPWVRANMVASVDGAVTGPGGRSAEVSTPADRRVFSLLRSLADVVLAGAGTVRAERYGPARARPELRAARAARGQRPVPVVAVASASLDLDPDWPLFTEAAEPTVVLTVDAAPADRRRALSGVADVVTAGEALLDIGAALDALAGRGLGRVLCEGGPMLLGGVVRAGLLDELCLTTSPLLAAGPARRVLHGAAATAGVAPPPPVGLALGHLLEEAGTLLARWVREPREQARTGGRGGDRS